jgi:hypothetical protein
VTNAGYDVFGFSSSDLEQVREALEDCLGIRFVPHESSFIGNYYLHGERYEKGNFLLRVNLDPEDGAPLYSEFSAFPILLEANDPDQSEQLAKLLQDKVKGCKLLYHKVVA